MKQFSTQAHYLAHNALQAAFGAEFTNLQEHDAFLIRQDFLEAECPASEYARRIGRGNLQSYADVMVVRERKGWDH